MVLPITAPLAISAIKALIRYRYRVDTILALSTAEEGLPFRLPKPPNTNHRAPLLKKDAGRDSIRIKREDLDGTCNRKIS